MTFFEVPTHRKKKLLHTILSESLRVSNNHFVIWSLGWRIDITLFSFHQLKEFLFDSTPKCFTIFVLCPGKILQTLAAKFDIVYWPILKKATWGSTRTFFHVCNQLLFEHVCQILCSVLYELRIVNNTLKEQDYIWILRILGCDFQNL